MKYLFNFRIYLGGFPFYLMDYLAQNENCVKIKKLLNYWTKPK